MGSHGTDYVDPTVANSKGSTSAAANNAASSSATAAYSADLKSQPPPVVRQ